MMSFILLLLTQAAPNAAASIAGEWINERRTATIRIADCPSGLCGTVTWSAAAARRDAKRSGTHDLNGTTVMFGFAPVAHSWRGKLFLPDRNRIVKGALELQEDGSLLVKGCELGGLICKSQRWKRWEAQ